MKYRTCFMAAASSLFCAALLAQGLNPATAPNPASPVVPVAPLVPAPVPVPALVSPVVPEGSVSPVAPVPVSPPPVSAPLAPLAPLPPVSAPPSGPLSRAEAAMTTWLAAVDAGDYAGSWHQAASLLQTAVSQPTWESALQAGRQPLGRMKSRLLKSATYSHTLVGAPDGEYVLIQYESGFEFKPQAIETLTVMKDKDSIWRVAGYFIK